VIISLSPLDYATTTWYLLGLNSPLVKEATYSTSALTLLLKIKL
jgi:hypothetical protein